MVGEEVAMRLLLTCENSRGMGLVWFRAGLSRFKGGAVFVILVGFGRCCASITVVFDQRLDRG